MYSRILVPLDGSESVAQILPYVKFLAKALPAKVDLLQVVEHVPPEWMDWAVGIQPLEIAAGMSQRAQEYLEGVESSLKEEGLRASSMIRSGSPEALIESEAEREEGTLVTMSTHGRSGATRWVMGSTTNKVLHTSVGPLLIVRSMPEETPGNAVDFKSITVPLDGSEIAEQVLPHAVALSRALGLDLIVLRVTLPTEEANRDLAYSEGPLDLVAEEYFSRVLESLRRQGIAKVEQKVLQGHPAAAIVDFAKQTPHNLMAISSHGRSGVGRWVLGSIADRVVRHCGSPVLLIRARK